MPAIVIRRLSMVLFFALGLTACEKPPPDHRAAVTLPVYTAGDADNGALIFAEACGQCHQLNAGLNKKGPQLMNIYGASAAALKDYTYSQRLASSGWVWDVKTLDPYLADVEKAMPESKMLADPMPDAKERADVIAYLSTLRNEVSAIDTNEKDSGQVSDTNTRDQSFKMTDEAITISSDPADKPAADFR